jgi:DNA-binding protein HU-beta
MTGISRVVLELADKTGFDRKLAQQLVRDVFRDIVNKVDKGEKISIQGFGTFSRITTRKRRGINPRTKQPITIPSRKKFHFAPSIRIKFK